MRHRSRRWARLGSLLGATIVYLGAMAATGSLSADGATSPHARSARTFFLNENGDLRLTSKQGFTLNERGSASGTITGTIYVHMSIVSTSRVKAEVSIYPKQGSITGYATASYVKGATKANFSGSISISRGSGGYSHVRGSGLSFSGTIARSNDAVTVRVSGKVAD